MRYGPIDKLLLFGGSLLGARFAREARERHGLDVFLYTCERQLNEKLVADGTTLEGFLVRYDIPYRASEDINSEPGFLDEITAGCLGIGLGEPWSFSGEIIDRFDGRLLDLMGIRLPQYRGGAHYTWQILRGCRMGGCCLQIVNEDTVQGRFDSGWIVTSKEYLFPSWARVPADYFQAAGEEEKGFLLEFLQQVQEGADFEPYPAQEMFSVYFPRLSTLEQGFIDWTWDALELERFVCGFDDPYPGASTFLHGERVFLKECRAEFGEGGFHPFQSGLVYRATGNGVYICTKTGSLIVAQVRDESGREIKDKVQVGDRFFTPRERLEAAALFCAEYTTQGLIRRDGDPNKASSCSR